MRYGRIGGCNSHTLKTYDKRRKNGVEIVLKIAGIGILVAAACQLLKQSGRDDIAMLTAVAGLVIVLSIVIGLIGTLFNTLKTVFELY